MKIDKLISGNIPAGVRVAAITNKTLRSHAYRAAVNTVPHGTARTRSWCTHIHTVILADDAIRLGIPAVAFGYL